MKMVLLCILFLVIGYGVANFNYNKYADEFCQTRAEDKASREYLYSVFNHQQQQPEATTTGSTMYEVKKGDTLDSIAKIFGVSKADLIRINKLAIPNLPTGYVLVIPNK